MRGTAGYGVVLLINDSPAQLNAMHLLLTFEGFTVWPAESAESAFNIMQGGLPGLIISDVVMPEVDGIELCRRIKSDPATVDIPILLISGLRYDDASVAEGLDAGADDYLEIDAPPSLLVKKARRLIAQAVEKRARLQAEAALRESGELYRIVAETVSDALVTIDENSTILFINLAAEKIFGYRIEEMVGQNLTVLMPEYLRALHQAALSRYVNTGKRHLTWKGVELTGLHKSGREIPLEISFAEYGGKDKHVFTGVIRDVTERKLAEAALRESEERFRSLIEATFDGIIIHKDGVIMDANQGFARMFGYELSEVVGRHMADFADEQYRDVIIENIRSGGVQIYEAVGVRKDGARINLELFGKDHVYKVQPVRVTALRDITREKKLQASLRHSETMAAMGELVAGVAHEVRNPLFSISSILDAFEARFAERAEYQRYTSVLRKELDRLNRLMQDLLEYGAPPPGRELHEGSVEDAIAQAIRSSAALARKSDVQIAFNTEGKLAPVLMDRSRLPQVFVNLLENAIHHSPPGGTVAMEARQVVGKGRNWIECAIKDSGPGFNAEDIEKVFDPFFTRRRGGTGLGLSIARRIMEAHGGSISAANRPHQGAVITVSLPVEPDHSRGKEELAGGEEQDSDHR
jgi:PAS domain S-box-containing protein